MVYAGYIILILFLGIVGAGAFYAPTVGPEVSALSTAVFEIFREEWLAPSIAVVMVALAFVLGVGYWVLYVVPIRRRVGALTNRIDSIESSQAFAEGIRDIDKDLGSHPLIGQYPDLVEAEADFVV